MSAAITVGDKLPSATFVTDGSKKQVTTEELCKGAWVASERPKPLACNAHSGTLLAGRRHPCSPLPELSTLNLGVSYVNACLLASSQPSASHPQTHLIVLLCSGKKVILVGMPGAFTPTCSTQHLPGFIDKADEFKKKGVDDIACICVRY